MYSDQAASLHVALTSYYSPVPKMLRAEKPTRCRGELQKWVWVNLRRCSESYRQQSIEITVTVGRRINSNLDTD
jgi:hypothetical protein